MNKKRVVVLCDIGRGTIVALTGLLYVLGYLAPWHLLILTFLNSTMEAFRGPAAISLLPRLLPPDQFDHAMGLNGTLSRVAELIGLGAAGVLIGVLGIGGTLIIDAAMFAIAALLLAWARFALQAAPQQQHATFWQAAREGLQCLVGNRTILWMCIIACIINPLIIPFNTLMAAFIQENLHLGVEALSASSTAITLLMGLGSLMYPFIKKHVRFASIIRYGLALIGLSYGILMLCAMAQGAWMRMALLIIASGLAGFAVSQVSTASSVMFIKTVPQSHLGRVSSLFNAVAMGITPLTSFAVAGVVSVVPINTLYGIMALLNVLIAVWLWFNKATRHLGEDEEHAAAAA